MQRKPPDCLSGVVVKVIASFFNFCFEGSMWRLPAPVGVRSIRRREEDPHHVSAEGAVRSRGGETSHRAPEHRGKKANDETRSH